MPTTNCEIHHPDGYLVGDIIWNGSVAISDVVRLMDYTGAANDCDTKPPSLFDPLNTLQFDTSGKVFGRFAGAPTITVYKISDGSTTTLSSNACTQIGATGIYYWDTSNFQTQPTVLTDYAWKMSRSCGISTTCEYYGKFTMKSKRAGNFYGDSTWILALTKTGKTCTIAVWDFAGNSIGLSSGAMAEIGTTGIFKWNTSNFSSQPGSETFYVYKMTCTGDTYTGCFSLKSDEMGGGGGGLMRNPPLTGGMV